MPKTTTLATVLAEHTRPAAEALVHTLDDGRLQCLACAHRCRIAEGRRGVCQVRFVQDGELRVPFGYVNGVALDPVEKKPFYHVLPGEEALSFGMLGCDLHCSYCQNWITSQALRDPRAVAPIETCTAEDIVDLATRRGSRLVVSTYNEPLITAEWAAAIFDEAHRRGMATGFVSNGNATPEVLDFLRPRLDLFKVDLKSFRDRHYRELGGTLQAVLDALHELKKRGFWVEVVTLVVPGFNDDEEELKEMATFLATLDRDMPWHLTAFYPQYRMNDRGGTPTSTLLRGWEIAKEAGLRFVYLGNLHGGADERESTWCPDCGALLVERAGFHVRRNRIEGGRCPDCGRPIPGVWDWPRSEEAGSSG